MTARHPFPGRAEALADTTVFDDGAFVLDDDATYDGDQLDREERAALRRELAASAGRLGRMRAFLALPPRPPVQH